MADDEQPDRSAFSGRQTDTDTTPSGGSDEADNGDNGHGSVVTPSNESVARPQLADLDRAERVELGVALLEHLEHESLPLSDAVDRIETITTNPSLTRTILDTAELRGVIDRESGRIRIRRGGTFVRFDESVARRRGDYECRRCGASLETGHFVRFEAGELGPFGPECVRKVLGRS